MIRQITRQITLALFLIPCMPALVCAYPLDGYAESGIRRIEGARLAQEGIIRGRTQPPGGQLSIAQVDLRLLAYPDMELPATDPEFSHELRKITGSDSSRYGLAVLDLSNPQQPRYAAHRDTHRQNVGSVGKIIVALGLFQALADAWPDDIGMRRETLKNTIIRADVFSLGDHHKVPLFDVDSRIMRYRPLEIGDTGSLWEYLDWMLSASSNAAASMVMRDAMLLKHYGSRYPVAEDEIRRFFRETSKQQLTALYQATFIDALDRNGLDTGQLRQGSFFTRAGKNRVFGGGGSYGTPRGLVLFSLRMEQGRLVDTFSSREIKRLLYMTARRIRYASSPALQNSAVYFKSGSLYSCREEVDFKCGKYMGNALNYMNSVALVEELNAQQPVHYIASLISNVLRENSAVVHQTMGTRIHRIIQHGNPKVIREPILEMGEEIPESGIREGVTSP